MKILVIDDLCSSTGSCEQIAPAVFRVGDDDILQVLTPEPSAEHHEAVRHAARACPKQAITLVE